MRKKISFTKGDCARKKNVGYCLLVIAAAAGVYGATEVATSWNPGANPNNDPKASFAWWTDAANWTGNIPAGGPDKRQKMESNIRCSSTTAVLKTAIWIRQKQWVIWSSVMAALISVCCISCRVQNCMQDINPMAVKSGRVSDSAAKAAR